MSKSSFFKEQGNEKSVKRYTKDTYWTVLGKSAIKIKLLVLKAFKLSIFI